MKKSTHAPPKVDRCHLFSDVDGTLLMSPEPPKINIEAVTRFMAAGGRFSLATGRSLRSSMGISRLVGTNAPSIVLDGAAIYDLHKDELVEYTPLPESTHELMERIVSAFSHVGASVATLREGFEVGAKREYAPPHHHDFRGRISSIPGEWLKLVFVLPDGEMDSFLEFIRQNNDDNMSVMSSGNMFASVMAAGCSKGSAIRRLCELNYIEPSEVAAIGDYHNDIEMLKAAAYAACPSNAIEEVQAVSHRVLGHAESGAVAQLIAEIMAQQQ